jgi:hypothetical protein
MSIGEQLIELRLRRPFVPFRITLKDGKQILLAEASKFAVSKFLMIIAQDHGPALRVRVDQVASIQVFEPIS